MRCGRRTWSTKFLAAVLLVCLAGGGAALWRLGKPAETPRPNTGDKALPSLGEPRCLR